MKQIPNIFTLLNLVFGCMAIVCILQYGLSYTVNDNAEAFVIMPEKIYMASIFIGCAAVIDFLDGFVARLLKASSEIGKQLDSLADVVSFGVAPGLIVYQFLRLSFAQQEGGLDVSTAWLLPAFVIPCAGAYRLARFNIDTTQSHGFKGVPIPAAGLLVASFPLIYWFSNTDLIIKLFTNQWFWYVVILVVSYLMVSKLPMLALKFSGVSIKKLMPFISIAAIAAITAITFGWIAVPVSFVAYVILSLLVKQKES
ncbi:CDP-diacylglycerol--serine O-phosphatidyltransferase [Panacibacter sp. DH6]|uniref:CDP-diacylglycerol--serine O-phosphatidyltransferase n=1 Tax=Panacibacter microcysteis TaxID=2793269 RepID=A0A931GYJ7_9BACT|nr:CDP-diacylglycerol--serine O-phosphatidyltransferase [Panacibacter microcysteis]MBG9376362.1 CDP-diacylglycerol--serine O-phosphatidyltransferase [Panacibacter microcysteis]